MNSIKSIHGSDWVMSCQSWRFHGSFCKPR